MLQSLNRPAKRVPTDGVCCPHFQGRVHKGWYGLPSRGTTSSAYVPRDRENCPSQVMYTRWDDDLSKNFMRIFSASVNENGKFN